MGVRQRGDQVEIRPSLGTSGRAPLGAEIHGLDASEPPPAELVLRLKQALRDLGPIFQNPAEVPVLASGQGGVAPEIVRVSNVNGYTGTGELSRLSRSCARTSSKNASATHTAGVWATSCTGTIRRPCMHEARSTPARAA